MAKISISEWSTVVATVAAAIAALCAFFYTLELNKPILSLVKSDITMELEWNFLELKLEFENVGNEPLKITKFLFGRYDQKANKFDHIEKPPLINALPPKQSFVYRKKMDMDRTIANTIRLYIEKNFPPGQIYDQNPKAEGIRNLFGKSIFIFYIEYKGMSSFSLRKKIFQHFFAYDGTRKYELSIEEYNEIKEDIPNIFTVK